MSKNPVSSGSWQTMTAFQPSGRTNLVAGGRSRGWRAALRRTAARASRRMPFLVDGYRLVHQPGREVELWRDHRATARAAKFIRRLPPPSGEPTGRALMVILEEASVYDAKLQMLLATALRLHGWHVIALVRSRNSSRTIRYCRSFGVDDIIVYEDSSPTEEERAACRREADRLLTSDLTFPDIKRWTFHDSAIGGHLLSTVSRVSLQGAPDPRQPEIRAEIEALTPRALEWVYGAEHVISSVGPDLLVVIEANYAVAGPLVDTALARGVDVIQANQVWRDDSLMCKRLTRETRRSAYMSLDASNLARLAERPWTDREQGLLDDEFRNRYGGTWFLSAKYQPGTSEKSRADIVEQLCLDAEKPIAVVFSHLLWDGNLFFGEDLFDNYGVWLIETAKAAAANPHVSWLIKMHPINAFTAQHYGDDSTQHEVGLIKQSVGELPENVRLVYPDTDISTFSLYQHADYCVTVRGTAGFEMPCFGKPALTAGTGRYDRLGFTIDSATKEEYLENLASLHKFGPLTPEQVRLAKWHALGVFRLRQMVLKSARQDFDFRDGTYHPLERNIVITAKSVAELRENADLDAFADFAADRRSVDFLDLSALS